MREVFDRRDPQISNMIESMWGFFPIVLRSGDSFLPSPSPHTSDLVPGGKLIPPDLPTYTPEVPVPGRNHSGNNGGRRSQYKTRSVSRQGRVSLSGHHGSRDLFDVHE